jgi:aldehyde dehydrogenase (NAD+)
VVDQAIAIAKRLAAKAVEKRSDNAPTDDANTRANGPGAGEERGKEFSMNMTSETAALLERLGVASAAFTGGDLIVRSPVTGDQIGALRSISSAEAEAAIGRAQSAFLAWRKVPAPRRGEFVRLLGEELRTHKADLGLLVTLEAGKVTSEGLGEVQEMIDICDFAVGLSRQLYGLTIATERPNHRMMETWHPLGVCGVISAFNFPVAVWSWNAALAFVCGDSVVWKPSEKTPLTALAVQAITLKCDEALRPRCALIGLSEILIGGREIGDILVQDHRVPVVSATGSTRMGKEVGQKLAARFARAILELGGNNAAHRLRLPPISTSRCAASPSPRWAPPASAAPRCAA